MSKHTTDIAPGPQAPPRKRRRVFLWIYLILQAAFIAWIISAVTASPAGPSVAAQTAATCAHGGWHVIFKSHADCMRHYAVALNDAGNAGTGLAVGFIVIIWIVVDFLTALAYGIYRLARRPARA